MVYITHGKIGMVDPFALGTLDAIHGLLPPENATSMILAAPMSLTLRAGVWSAVARKKMIFKSAKGLGFFEVDRATDPTGLRQKTPGGIPHSLTSLREDLFGSENCVGLPSKKTGLSIDCN